MAFRGWPMEALDFFEGLEADNSKTYWNEHKATYDDKVLAPMVALLAELEDEFGATKVFRPPRAELLRNKGLIAWQEWTPAAWLSKPAAKDRVAEFLRASRPLMSWLDSHVGESTNPQRGR